MFEHLSIFDEVIRRTKMCLFLGATLYKRSAFAFAFALTPVLCYKSAILATVHFGFLQSICDYRYFSRWLRLYVVICASSTIRDYKIEQLCTVAE